MRKIICVMLLFVSCVYGSSDEIGNNVQKAGVYVKNLSTVGIGYCLGYDIGKLYDEFEMSWFKHVDKSARNAIISEIKDVVDTHKQKSEPPHNRKYDETARLFINCFLMDYREYRRAMQHIAEKYCVENCDGLRWFWGSYYLTCE